ncbi:DUF1367 family protein [Endozoicomonas atrinae]|uniref:DUF1367 family protein n=1 Tax=Endozoicomonas atrinae TaxID=1333660 RepID=UPI000826F006|nr:DUF1367 family protein [Endozoicomonas atrinae]
MSATLELVRGNDPQPILRPVSASDEQYIYRLRPGEMISAEVRRARNALFHRKFMKLCSIAFNVFERLPQPPVRMARTGQWVTPRRDFNEFRYWAMVQAGFYEVIGYPDGGVRARAKSVAFKSMEQVEFEQVYSAVLDVFLQLVLNRDGNHVWSREEVESLVEQFIHFDRGQG